MEETENPEEQVAREQERRGMPRCRVDADAALFLVSHGSEIPCRMVELSLGGCRIEVKQRVSIAVGIPVEAIFKIQGIAFRLSGLTEWSAGKITGLSFGPMTSRRRDDLMEVLCEVEAKNAREAAEKGVETGAKGPEAGPVSRRGPVLVSKPPSVSREWSATGAESEEPAEQLSKAPIAIERERRLDRRCEVDTSAVIYLVKIGSKLNGQILDLSLGGCRIHTTERFPVGIYTRVETEFRLRGLPLRLAGVIQAIHDRNLVGIRFLDVSPRKREQIAELIDEIVEMRGVDAGE
jgi:c-di-GMP-binding flagellar brake protein YcgR